MAPVGRLDVNSKGLLLMSQDGRLVDQVIGQNSQVDKEYLVRIAGQWSEAKAKRFQKGMQLDGVDLKQAQVKQLESNLLQVTLIEGRKRQIRRMLEELDLEVEELIRVRIGKLKLEGLPEGMWRKVYSSEII